MVFRAKVHATFLSFFFSSRRRHTRCSRDWSSDVCSSDLASHGESFRTAEEVLRLPKFRCISGIDKLDGGIFPGNCDPRVDALNKLFDDWLRIRGIAGPFGLDIAAVMHEPREAISFDELGSKNFRQASLCGRRHKSIWNKIGRAHV